MNLFLKTKEEKLKFLEYLIECTKNMTPEELAQREKSLGVDKVDYDPASSVVDRSYSHDQGTGRP